MLLVWVTYGDRLSNPAPERQTPAGKSHYQNSLSSCVLAFALK